MVEKTTPDAMHAAEIQQLKQSLANLQARYTTLQQQQQEIQLANECMTAIMQTQAASIANISHDVRTPFTGILGAASILKKCETDPEKSELISYIISSSEQLLTLVNDVLSNISTQIDYHIKPTLTSFNLQETLAHVQAMVAPAIKQKSLDLQIHYPNKAPTQFIGDQTILKQILLNLLTNALKFTEAGDISVIVNFEPAEQTDKLNLILQVTDTGIGIAKDKQDIIFDRFSQVHTYYDTKQFEGNGLGLWQTKKWIEKLHGKIDVVSDEGKGATFTCIIPLALPNTATQQKATNLADDDSSSSTHYQQATPDKIAKQWRILLVEDDTIASTVASYMLTEQFNSTLDHAKLGADAIQLANQHAYDVVILDITLPDMNGFEVAKQIRTHSTPNQKTLIIGLTAHDNQTLDDSNYKPYCDTIFSKPLSNKVCTKIAYLLENK